MKKVTFLVFVIVIFFSCQQSSKKNIDNYVIENNTQLLRSLMEVWESGDTLKTVEIFTTNCEYTDVANNTTLQGIQGVNGYIGHVHNWASNVQMKIRKINVSETMGYVEWTFTAIQSSPIKGRVPVATNRNITLNGTTLVEFKDGKIQKASDYMDVLGFVIQLGAIIELPGGVIIGK